MKVVAIVQARMGSSRLPGKVMLDLGGEPLLARCVERVRRSRTLDEVVVATTSLAADDAIEELCRARGWPCVRGSEVDVLDRYRQAAVAHRAEVVVRVTSDCPLIDPEIVDRVVAEFLSRQPAVDYACNMLADGECPRGLDVEVMRVEALSRAWRDDTDAAWREHVTPFIVHHPELFRIHHVVLDMPRIRWTVDAPEDLVLVRLILGHFGHDRFLSRDVLQVLAAHPEWAAINARVPQTVVPDHGPASA